LRRPKTQPRESNRGDRGDRRVFLDERSLRALRSLRLLFPRPIGRYLSSNTGARGPSCAGASSGLGATGVDGVTPAASAPLPFGVRFRRGRISYRLIISFNVVGLMWSSSAARFWTPPAAS